MDFRQASLYRTYNPSVVPAYLQVQPRSTILHCLHHKASNKFSSNDIHDIVGQVGVFEVHGKNQTYRVDFGISTGMPSCTYRDWQNYHIPCKHFFGGVSELGRLDLGQTSKCLQSIFPWMRVPSQNTSLQAKEQNSPQRTHPIASPSPECNDTPPVESDFDELPKKVPI